MCIHEKMKYEPVLSLGQLLKDKNALLNYIRDDAGNNMGVVVGMKGADRGTPLVGWALFSEFDDGRIVMDKRSKPVREAVRKVHMALEEFARVCNNESTAGYIEDLKLQMDMPDHDVVIPYDIKYRTVELAILRANSDREHWFVCTNPAYCQEFTDLKPEDNGGNEYTYLTYGSDYHNPYDGYAIPYIRQACRAMEFRCWRFFKPFIYVLDSNAKVSNKRSGR